MTTKEAIRTLKTGDRVQWRETENSAPELELGIVNQSARRIEWPDGQITLFCDDCAMAHVYYAVSANNPPRGD